MITNLGSRWLVVWILLVFVFTTCVAGQDVLSSKVSPSFVTLKVQRADGSVQTGNGFLTLRDGVVATAWHIVKDAKRVVAKFPGGDEYECTGLIDKDETRNVALIRIKLFGRQMLQMSGADSVAGDIINMAAVKDSAFGILKVKVDEPANSDGTVWAKLEGETPVNNSGSPLIDDNGTVIGILTLRKPGEDLVGFMIPARFILALDSSLPTQPWSQITSAATPTQPTATPGPQVSNMPEIDSLIGKAFVTLSDNMDVIVWADVGIKGYGFRNGVPKPVYDFQQELDAVGIKLAEVRTDDQLRLRVIKSLLQVLALQKASSENFIRSVVIGQQLGVWGAQSQDAFNRASANIKGIEDKLLEMKTDIVELDQASEKFREWMFPKMRYWLRLVDRPTGYSLGAVSYARRPFFLLVVYNTGVAYKIGLRAGDNIKSIAGQDPTPSFDIEAVKVIIKENLGKKIDAVVERNGKIENIKLKIPKEIPPEAIYK